MAKGSKESSKSEDANLIAVEDYDLYLRIFELGNFILIKKFLIFYRFHLGSVSKSGIDDKLRRQKLFKIRGIKNIYTDKKWIKRKHLKNNIVFIFFNNLIQFFLINKIKIFGYISTALDLDSLIYVDNSKK